MKHKSGVDKSVCNVISFKSFKDKKINETTSTIAAIIAIKIEHPKNISPEDYLINKIESFENIEVLAFEDALDGNAGITTIDAQNDALNDA